jgi:alkanesulfonate monooxygenase SsuD/methylene tetrahydromethanopterin reductase-like flavin-dependent oxidoreductase (luciferase family)
LSSSWCAFICQPTIKFEIDTFMAFAGVQAHPQRNVPVVIGGHTPAAYRRAVAAGNGWYGFALDLDEIAQCLTGLAAASTRTPRPLDLGDLEISVTPRFALTQETLSQCAALGVHRLIIMPPRFVREEELRAYVESLGDLVAAYGEQ